MTKGKQIDFDALFDEPAVAHFSSVPQTGLRPDDPADSVDEWLGDRKPHRPRRPRTSRAVIEAYLEDAGNRAKSGDWESVGAEQVGGLMAALYAICHERVYGVRPLEALAPEAFPVVVAVAAKQHREGFKSDAHLMAQFIRWVWDRERKREEWRAENGRETSRIGWRLQFSVSSPLLTDYRLVQEKLRKGRPFG